MRLTIVFTDVPFKVAPTWKATITMQASRHAILTMPMPKEGTCGLSVTGLSYKGLTTLTAKVLRHVRAIMGNQVHVGGDSNQRVLQQVRLEFPGEMLLLQTAALITRITDAADPMLPESVLTRLKRVSEELGGHCRRYHEECQRAAEYLRDTQTTDIVRPQDGAPLAAMVSGRCGLKAATLVCDRCFLCLPDLKALKAHMRQQHDHRIPHMMAQGRPDACSPQAYSTSNRKIMSTL